MSTFVKHIICLLLAAIPLAGAANVSKATADSAFKAGRYSEAIAAYDSILQQCIDAEVLYNQGVAYYRTSDIPRAILAFERTLRYAPSHADARFNLSVCRSKAGISETGRAEMFFVTWWHQLVQSHSADYWGAIALAAIAASALLFGMRRSSSKRPLQLTAACIMPLALIAFAISITAASLQSYAFHYERRAVVMQEAALVGENGSKQVASLPPGTTLTILDFGTDGNHRVATIDGRQTGWIKARSIEII